MENFHSIYQKYINVPEMPLKHIHKLIANLNLLHPKHYITTATD